MSSQPPAGFDPYAGGGQPSEAEVQQMLAQMRVMPVDQHLAQVFQLMLEGAQVKIGRNDGRLLLDSTAALVNHVRPVADADLVAQVDEALAQLRMAQVQAETELQRAAVEEGHAETNDLPTPPPAPGAAAPGTAAPKGESASATAQGASAASRLWTPGV